MSKTITLPKLQPWQKDVYDKVATAGNSGNIFVVKSKRQVGKSILAICLLIRYALVGKSISICVEPTQAQSRRMFKQLCDFLQGADVITSSNSTLLSIEFVNGSEILFKSAEQRDALRGFSVTNGLLVIDEAAMVPDSIFEILYPVTDASSSPILVISTPLFQSGEFFRLYTRGLIKGGRVTSFDWSKYDTSVYLPEERLEYYRQTMSPLKFKSEYAGDFISDGSYIFGDYTANIGEYSHKPSVYGGIDWGTGNNGDSSVVILMDEDKVVTKIWSVKDMDATEQVEAIADILNAEPTLKVVNVEMNSIGRVFYDMLKRKTDIKLHQFITTNDSKRRIVEQLIEAFQTRKITIPNDEELNIELQHYNMEKTKTGYTYNGADGVHDDYCIALSLALDAANNLRTGRIVLV